MRKAIIVFTVFVIGAIFTSSAFAADAAKIGVVNFEQIVKVSSAGKVMQKDLKARLEELQKKLQDEGKKVKEMQDELEREALVLSEEKKRERKRELRDKADDLKRMKTDYTQEMQILQNNRMNQIQKDIFDIANRLGQTKGYLLIVEKKVGGVIYAADEVDITDEVIKEYNLIYAKKK